MPTFPTPRPIHLTLELAAGDARITASERDDTVVEVRPRDPARKADVRVADETRIELADDRLLVKTPRPGLGGWARGGAVDVTIALPEGSRLDGHSGAGDLRAEGRLGDAAFKAGAGALRLGRTGALKAISGAGDVSVEAADGTAVVITGSGAVRLGAVSGDAIVKSGNGPTTVGDVGGNLRVMTGNGDVVVERSRGSVVVKTANGSVRALSLESGEAELRTAFGAIEIGIAEGTAARLDIKTEFGMVRQELEPTGAPPTASRTVSVKARTSMGDITIRRAPEAGAGAAAA
ncbi:MAG TPA: DUF4097 family beta strand repeat-containing protein [Baekduia sp.]